jgi:hypothetical protein
MENLAFAVGKLPGLVVFGLTVSYVFLAVVAGVWWSKRRPGTTTNTDIGTAVGATLGLLAFLLAFTFNMAANRFDDRKQLFVDEVNAIGTAYLRAELLPGPYASESRQLLREYVDLRVRLIGNPDLRDELIAKSGLLQERLWRIPVRMAHDGPLAMAQNLYVQALNELIDLHTLRVTVGLYFTIPTTIWFALYVIVGLAMLAVGYQFAKVDRGRFTIAAVLAIAFSSVMFLIVDLDRAGQGFIQIDQKPMLLLHKSMHK